MIAVIPVDSYIRRFGPGEIPIFNVAAAVKVNLTRDNDFVGSVTFSHTADQINGRATEATFLLSGSYVQIKGEAMFEVPDGELLAQVLREVEQ
jgi:hypothetical protein